jgi:xanthine dehydrogenase YagT iron-sulfur-binding subunit
MHHNSEASGGCSGSSGITRRKFMISMGAASMMVAGTSRIQAAQQEDELNVEEAGAPDTQIRLRINGRDHYLLVENRWTLLTVLREVLGLTGTKLGCGRGECGACTVLLDGIPRYACLTLAVEAQGKEITTLEGLMRGEELGPVQQAFLEMDAYQCGYCTPGQIMAVEGLLRAEPDPGLSQIQTGVSGNLCRCGAYVNIFKAAKRAAELKQG